MKFFKPRTVAPQTTQAQPVVAPTSGPQPASPQTATAQQPAAPQAPTAQPLASQTPTAQPPAGTSSTTPAPTAPVFSGMNVNFIREQRRKFEQTIEKDKKISKHTMYALIAFMIVFLATLVTHFWLNRQQTQLVSSIDSDRQQLRSMSAVEREYVVYARKVQLLFEFDKQKQVKEQATDFFYTFIPSENVLKEARTQEDATTIVFQVLSPDVFRVLDLLKLFSSSTITERGYAISVERLTRAPEGTYTLYGVMDYAGAATLAAGGTQ